MLDLGYVGETAKLLLNGEHVATKIIPPYVFDVTDFLKEGKNEIEVEVSTHLGYAIRDPYTRYLPLEATGLLGPVVLKKQKENV